MLSNEKIQEYHRHRFPYLLIDCIEEMIPGKSVKGYKYFSENEWFFHCNDKEGYPVPFTMLIEILTEMFLMPVLVLDDNKGKITNFLSADDAYVYRDVYPGDCLQVVANVESWKRGIASGMAKGYIDKKLVCTVKLKFAIPDILNKFSPKQ